jgi:hypothetical protein
MSIKHKFQETDFKNGFQTHNAILDVIPYNPEVIFIGTFNHGWDWNLADFFYGRGMYMWPVLANLFLYNKNDAIINPRSANINPTISEIYKICKLGKITFADIVKGTKENIPVTQIDNSILVNDEFKWSKYSDKEIDYMGNCGWLDDNVQEIIDYINSTKSIKYIYFTFKTGGWVVKKMNLIKTHIIANEIHSLCSPSGNGFGNLLFGFPTKSQSIAHCWLWNGLANKNLVNKKGYSHLNHAWLMEKGVTVTNF